MAVYNINGQILTESSNVYISELKQAHPSYNDDALLDEAIRLAALQGKSTRIIWDGSVIHFSGRVQHDCSGFGGIDFAGSRIVMPSYDEGVILNIAPDDSTEATLSADVIGVDRTTEPTLMGKIFAIGDVYESNAGMLIGTRTPASAYDGKVLYCVPTVVTTKTGSYSSGKLYLVPQAGTVYCRNIHSYPETTFEVCNATIVSYSGAVMSLFLQCSRSNVHVHDLTLEGRSGVTTFHKGILYFEYCSDVRVDHISGINPMQRDHASGYFFMLRSITFAHVSDVYVGDEISWGAMGTQFIANTVVERCYLNRWDSHFLQFGYNVVRECVLNQLLYGGGSGAIEIENCVFLNNLTSNSELSIISVRGDVVATFDGDIIVKNCVFSYGAQPASKVRIWNDSFWNARPSDCTLPAASEHGRYLINCKIPDGCASVFFIGSSTAADKALFANLIYGIKDTHFVCANVVNAPADGQTFDAIRIEGCRFTADRITDNVKTPKLFVNDSETFGSVRVTQNTSLMVISNSDIGAVISDQQSAALTLTGCRVNGEQSFSKFTNYAAYGNISGRGTQYTAALNTNV